MNLCTVVGAFLMRALVNIALPTVVGFDFEAFLRQTAEEIIDHAVCEFISEADRIVFEEEASDVTS